jgi:hypothetical protein
MPTNYYRDYDILSNKYKEYHEQKVKTDKDIYRYEAAKKFCKRNDFNPILSKFNDMDKEAKYQEKQKVENDLVASKERKVLNRNAKG